MVVRTERGNDSHVSSGKSATTHKCCNTNQYTRMTTLPGARLVILNDLLPFLTLSNIS